MNKKEHTPRSRQYGCRRFLRFLLKSCIALSVCLILLFGLILYYPEVQRFLEDIRQYTYFSIPASKESDMIAFSCYRDGVTSLYTIYPDGSHLRFLRQNRSQHHGSPKWSPDGIWIALAIKPLPLHWFYGEHDSEIYRIRFDGLNFQRLTYNPYDERVFQWAHDGRSILLDLRELYQMFENEYDIKQWEGFYFYGLSPDGSSLALANFSAIYRNNPDGSGLQLLKELNPDNFHHKTEIKWAPDNERLIIHYHEYSRLYVLNVETLEDFTVDIGVGSASFAPNGKWLAIVGKEDSYYENGKWIGKNKRRSPNNLYLFDINTGAIREVVKDVGRGLSWSPDSAWIAFSQDGQLFKIKWDGTALQQLTKLDCSVSGLSWSPK